MSVGLVWLFITKHSLSMDTLESRNVSDVLEHSVVNLIYWVKGVHFIQEHHQTFPAVFLHVDTKYIINVLFIQQLVGVVSWTGIFLFAIDCDKL